MWTKRRYSVYSPYIWDCKFRWWLLVMVTSLHRWWRKYMFHLLLSISRLLPRVWLQRLRIISKCVLNLSVQQSPHLDQDRISLPEHLKSPPLFTGIVVAQSWEIFTLLIVFFPCRSQFPRDYSIRKSTVDTFLLCFT